MDKQLPLFEYPTLTVLVDDSRTFLEGMLFHFDGVHECKAFSSPKEAIEWLRSPAVDALLKRRIGSDSDPSLGMSDDIVPIENLGRIAMDIQRFNMPTVLVADYTMPQMNGVEFFENVRNLPCKKILLTGSVDERIAVHAFNRNLIDRFIRKDDLKALENLADDISGLQRVFFNERYRSGKLLLPYPHYSFLFDPEVFALVSSLRKKHAFVESYLSYNPPGIRFLDKHGNSTLMVIETEDGLRAHHHISATEGAPPSLLSALSGLHIVPFFYNTDGIYSKHLMNDWQSYVLPAELCRGSTNYYWALFESPPHYFPDPVAPYAEFLSTHTSHV